MTVKNYFWDSCVFIAYLNNDEGAYDVHSLQRFIVELGKEPGCLIHTSTITLAEVTPRRMRDASFGSFEEFLNDFRTHIQLIDVTPPVLTRAGRLKDV